DLWGGRRDAAGPPPAGATRALMKQNSQRLIRAVLDLEKPMVAAVNGVAAGMGAHLALACDLVVMAAEARLIEVFARRGLAIDSGGAFLLSRLVGLLKAKELVRSPTTSPPTRRSAWGSATGSWRARDSRRRRASGASGSHAARRSRSACRSAFSSAPTRAGSRPASRRRRSRRRWSRRARTCRRACGPSPSGGGPSSRDARVAYTLLGGVRVLELALLAPDLLGMHLGDLGAEVVKIEQPPGGDYLREIGARKLAGLNLMHLRWNRGKKSLTLDLKRAEGQRLLHRLVATADVFIDGLRQGAA